MRLDVASISQLGTRDNNEDRIFAAVTEGIALFAVADGLGGHGGGDVAAGIAIAQMENAFHSNCGDLEACIEQSFQSAQAAILEYCQLIGNRHGIKTTLTLLVVANDFRARWAHIGDSRLYYFPARRAKRYRRTLDHSVSQTLASRGEIKEKQIRFHEDRSFLLRALGEDMPCAEYDLGDETPLRQGDAILLCSDGFWEWIPEQLMIGGLKKAASANEWLGVMEQLILRAGNGQDMDNYSAIAIIVK